MFLLSDLAPKPTKAANHADAADLGATARQAMIEIFRNRDTTAIDRFFSEPFVQHDPNIADGLSGLKAFAAEVASSPTANVTIYRTLVDGDIVMLHSKYEGVRGFAGPVIAFDLFRFKGGKIVEHWGRQDAEEGCRRIRLPRCGHTFRKARILLSEPRTMTMGSRATVMVRKSSGSGISDSCTVASQTRFQIFSSSSSKML